MSSTTAEPVNRVIALVYAIAATAAALVVQMVRVEGYVQLPFTLNDQMEALHALSPAVRLLMGYMITVLPYLIWYFAVTHRWHSRVPILGTLCAGTFSAVVLGGLLIQGGFADQARAVHTSPAAAWTPPTRTMIATWLRPACTTQSAPAGVVMQVVCAPSTGPDKVTFRVYRTRPQLTAAWRLTPASPQSRRRSRQYHEGPRTWPRDGKPAGRMAIYSSARAMHLDWTDVRNLTLASVMWRDGDAERLERWWDNGQALR